MLLTDANGAVTDEFAYGPYGEAGSRTGSTDTPFQFNGRYGVTTEPGGILCMRARFYHPFLHRFLNQDTLLGTISFLRLTGRALVAPHSPMEVLQLFVAGA